MTISSSPVTDEPQAKREPKYLLAFFKSMPEFESTERMQLSTEHECKIIFGALFGTYECSGPGRLKRWDYCSISPSPNHLVINATQTCGRDNHRNERNDNLPKVPKPETTVTYFFFPLGALDMTTFFSFSVVSFFVLIIPFPPLVCLFFFFSSPSPAPSSPSSSEEKRVRENVRANFCAVASPRATHFL